MQEEGNTKGWKIEGGKEGKTRKGKVGKSQRLRLWTKHNPSAAMHHLLCWARSVFFKMSAVISSGIIRLSDRAPDAFRGKALRQHTLVAHLSTNTHTHSLCSTLEQHETKAHEVRLRKNCYCSAIQHKCRADGRRQRKKRTWEEDFEDYHTIASLLHHMHWEEHLLCY